MAIFQYRAKTKSGDNTQGVIEARNREEAVELLSRQDVLPVSIAERQRPGLSRPYKGSARLSFKEIYFFTRQLSNLTKSGIPLLRALEIIRQQSQKSSLAFILDDLHQRIRDGENLSDSLAQYPLIFSSLYVAMVRVGEEGGNLQQVLAMIAAYQKAQSELSSKVRTALAYPVFMAVVGFATILFILIFVMPKISQLFVSAGQVLPWPTQMVLKSSQFLRQGWFVALPACALLFFSVLRWAQTRGGKKMIDRITLQTPLLGSLILKAQLAHFCRTLQMLLHSGVPLIKALRIAVPTLDNEWTREDFLPIASGLEAGQSLSTSFQNCHLIPPMVVSLITVAEESGQLEDMLADIADYYEQETSEMIKVFTTILEPLMILIVGAIVGFIVFAMLLPIFQMDVLAR